MNPTKRSSRIARSNSSPPACSCRTSAVPSPIGKRSGYNLHALAIVSCCARVSRAPRAYGLPAVGHGIAPITPADAIRAKHFPALCPTTGARDTVIPIWQWMSK